jgi:hypothetical protein
VVDSTTIKSIEKYAIDVIVAPGDRGIVIKSTNKILMFGKGEMNI